MNNKRLQQHCCTFISDQGDTIEQRCFFLFSGEQINDKNGPSDFNKNVKTL